MASRKRETIADDKVGAGSQTLMRGLDVIEMVAQGNATLLELSKNLALTKSTAHRLASALVGRGFLSSGPRGGTYRLGPKFLELGEVAQLQTDVVQIAKPFIESLANITSDTVHLAVLDGTETLYLDKVPGQRRINISSRVGERQPLTTTGLGKALILDHPVEFWRERWSVERDGNEGETGFDAWALRMSSYVAKGRTYDLEENEDRIRCVAAPVRDVRGKIVAAISVSSAAQYMDDRRMEELSDDVKRTAEAISKELGYRARTDE